MKGRVRYSDYMYVPGNSINFWKEKQVTQRKSLIWKKVIEIGKRRNSQSFSVFLYNPRQFLHSPKSSIVNEIFWKLQKLKIK